MPDFGISTERIGIATANGNASATVFTIAHGLGMTPAHIMVIGSSADSFGQFDYTGDGTNITVTFSFPPPTGTGNLVFYYRVGA